ncbi:MAG: hypothetical protein GDA43_19810 [Hormoscilla sp. SP5CHS1]|nr:hypothetical protein [Hormoscilla sp. SP5CHS1]
MDDCIRGACRAAQQEAITEELSSPLTSARYHVCQTCEKNSAVADGCHRVNLNNIVRYNNVKNAISISGKAAGDG